MKSRNLLIWLVALMITANMGSTKAYTNKTFMMPRPQGVNLPLEKTTFHKLIHTNEQRLHNANLQVAGFYQASTDEKNISKYFLIRDKSQINFQTSRSDIAPFINAKSTVNDLDFQYLGHSPLGTEDVTFYNNANMTLKLSPEQKVYGFFISGHHDLSKLLHGLYATAQLPITYVQNKTSPQISSSDPQMVTDFTQILTGIAPEGYGNQQTLTKSKMGGNQTAIGIADIDLSLGYKFFQQEWYYGAFAAALTIPTGNKAKGEYVFEPICGNGDHFGLGADLGGGMRVWGDFNHNVKINAMVKYRYLFEHNEVRTLGIKGREFGQYFMLGTNNTLATIPLIPAANILTVPVDVTPGSQCDAVLSFAYNYKCFTFDLGYNLYYREHEMLNLKNDFAQNTYAIAARGFNVATTAFTITEANVDNGNVDLASSTISNSTVDLNAATTPEQLTNSIYAGLGYVSEDCPNPWMFGIGGKYEWPSHNSALEQWNVWAKVGIGF